MNRAAMATSDYRGPGAGGGGGGGACGGGGGGGGGQSHPPKSAPGSLGSSPAPSMAHHVAPPHVTGNINATYRIHPKMFNSQRYQKNKSIKKVSPKSRRTAELYKSSHNIGNRTAAERVGSYKETEVALVYPEGFWEAVKVEDGSTSPIDSHSRSRSRSPKSSPRSLKSSPRSPYNELSPTRSSKRNMYSPIALPLKRKRINSDSLSSESEEESSEEESDSQASMRESKVSFEKKDGKNPSRSNCKGSSRECSEETGHGRKGPKPGGKSSHGGRSSSAGGEKSGKKSKPKGVRPRAPRIKRTACLNAAAIVGLLYESEEPAHKKRKVEVEVEEEVITDSDDMYDLQFDLDLKKALAASLEEVNHKSKKSSSSKDISVKHSCDSSSKKAVSYKEKDGKQKKDKQKDREKDHKLKVRDEKKDKDKLKDVKKDSKDLKKESKEIKDKKEKLGKDKKVKKMKKDKDKGEKEKERSEKDKVKSKKDRESSKKVVSKKVKKDKKEKSKDKEKKKKKEKERDKDKSKKKIKEQKKEESEEESEEDEESEEEEEEKEIEVPLWPPPKRMASLNATAILAASKEPRKVSLERAARTVMYSKDRMGESAYKKKPKSEMYRGFRHETGRWVEGLGMKEIESNKNYDPYAFHDSPVEVAEVARDTPSPEIQVLAVDPAPPPPARSASPVCTVQPSPSPDVQIIEVKGTSPVPQQPPRQHQTCPREQSPRQTYPAHHAIPQPSAQVSRPGLGSPSHNPSPSRVSSSGPIQPYPSPHPSQIPHHHRSQRVQPLPAHHSHMHHAYYHHPSSQSHVKPYMPTSRHLSPQHHSPHHSLPPPPPQQPPPPQAPPHHPHAGYPHHLTQANTGTPPQVPPPAHQPHPHPLPPHPPPGKMYEDTMMDRMTPSQTPPVAQGSYQSTGHGYVHQSSPIGNTCTYPYPHSTGGGGSGAAGAAGPPGGSQNNHCQGFPFGSMGSVSSYHMMACHSRPFGSAFSVPTFNHHSFVYFAGYYPADGLMDAMGETCCMPLSYHIQQQHVKVLVHNTAIPPYPTGPNPYHHPNPNPTPTITPIPDHPSESPRLGAPKETKHSPGGMMMPPNSSGDTSHHPVISSSDNMAPQSRLSSYSSYYAEKAERGPPYKPEQLMPERLNYKVETQSVSPPPACISLPRNSEQQQQIQQQSTREQAQRDQVVTEVTHKEEKVDVTCDIPDVCSCSSTPEKPLSAVPATVSPHPSASTLLATPDTRTATKREKTSPKTVTPQGEGEECSSEEKRQLERTECKPEKCPSPATTTTTATTSDSSTTTPSTSSTSTTITTTCNSPQVLPPPAEPEPQSLAPHPEVDTTGEEGGGQSRAADKLPSPNPETGREEGKETSLEASRGDEPNNAPQRPGDRQNEADKATTPSCQQQPCTDLNCVEKPDSREEKLSLITPSDKGSVVSDGRPDKDTTKGLESASETSQQKPTSYVCPKAEPLTENSPKNGDGTRDDINNGVHSNGKANGESGEAKKTNGKVKKAISKEGPGEKKSKERSVVKSPAKKVISTLKASKANTHGNKCPSGTKIKRISPKKTVSKDSKKQLAKQKSDIRKQPKPASKQKISPKCIKAKKDLDKPKPKKLKDLPKRIREKQSPLLVKKQPSSPKQKKVDITLKPKKSDGVRCVSPTLPKVKVEPCSPKSPKIKKEVEEVSPKRVPSPKQLRVETSSPKSAAAASCNPRTLSPKLKREAESPRSAPSPKTRREEGSVSPKQRKQEISPRTTPTSTPSPRLRDQQILPTNKVLRVHVEALNPMSLSPKLREATASPKNREATGSRLRREGSVSPKAPKKEKEEKRGEEKKVMLGPRKMVPVMRTQPAHSGWRWEGKPLGKEHINHQSDNPVPIKRRCYPAIRHDDGDVIQVRDCVLVRSGPRRKDVPYVAKIGEFWEDPETGEMMMDVIWYYRPEQAESDRLPRHVPSEVFASKHKDQASIACIDDKCFVLTFNEYCRYKSHQKQVEMGFIPYTKLVPQLEQPPPKRQRIPRLNADPETVFVCRRVYDFKLKRILKNPAAN